MYVTKGADTLIYNAAARISMKYYQAVLFMIEAALNQHECVHEHMLYQLMLSFHANTCPPLYVKIYWSNFPTSYQISLAVYTL